MNLGKNVGMHVYAGLGCLTRHRKKNPLGAELCDDFKPTLGMHIRRNGICF